MAESAALRIGIVVGEASGDMLGAGLMQAILTRYPNARFEGIGGAKMLELGFNSFYPQDRLAVMGLVEPLKRLPELLRIRRHIVRHFIQNPPDLFIGIDSPDFNLTIEQRLRAAGIVTAHYVSPSVWAWRQKRIVKIAKAVDMMLTLLPFEADFYRQHQVPVTFVGHPLADSIPLVPDTLAARKQLGLESEATWVALLPGSRGGEVNLLGPVFWQTARQCLQRLPDLQFIVPAANVHRRQQIEAQLQDYPDLPITVVEGNSHRVLEAADAVLMTSGTTTLESMLFKKPMVVAYKFTPLSYWIFSRLVKVEHFSLPNLLAGRALVPELLQDQATPERLAQSLLTYLLEPDKAEALRQEFTRIHQRIRLQASDKAAEALLNLIGGR